MLKPIELEKLKFGDELVYVLDGKEMDVKVISTDWDTEDGYPICVIGENIRAGYRIGICTFDKQGRSIIGIGAIDLFRRVKTKKRWLAVGRNTILFDTFEGARRFLPEARKYIEIEVEDEGDAE